MGIGIDFLEPGNADSRDWRNGSDGGSGGEYVKTRCSDPLSCGSKRGAGDNVGGVPRPGVVGGLGGMFDVICEGGVDRPKYIQGG